MTTTEQKIKKLMDYITFNPIDGTFTDKNGRDCKRKKSVGYWYVVKSIDGIVYEVLAHHFIYYSLTETLPKLKFIGSKNELTFGNLKVIGEVKKVVETTPKKVSDDLVKIYVKSSDLNDLKLALTKSNITYGLSKAGYKMIKAKATEHLKQKSQGLFPLTCGNPDRLILICTDQLLDHSGPFM